MYDSLLNRLGNSMNIIVIGLLSFITLYPFLQVIMTSFSSSRAIMSGEVFLWPVDFNLDTYKAVFQDGQIIVALKNTVIITIVGTIFNMIATVMAAYPLSKRDLMGRNWMLVCVTFTLVFGAGMIPNFVVVKMLGLLNTFWAIWLPGLVSTWNFFVMKTYFEGLPEELEEASEIDGANDLQVLIRVIIPLSLPMLAALTLFYAVGLWNNYFNVLLYITDPNKLTIMVKLLQMISNVDPTQRLEEGVLEGDFIIPEGIQAASMVVAIVPIMLVYPFLQKYFIKGVLIGSVKG